MKRPGDQQPGHAISATEWNRIVKEVYRLSKFAVQYPLELNDVGTNPMLRVINPEIDAVLTSNGPAYSWSEVQPDGDGTWTVVPDGRSGTATSSPAYEANDLFAPKGTVVILRPGRDEEYIFDHCCTTGGAS